MTINTLTKKNFFQIVILCTFLTLSGFIHTITIKPEIILNKQSTALNINQDFLKLFSIGQNRLIADIYWISSLLESDLEHYKNKDLNSWLYLRFKSIIELDPLFLRAYQFGGKYLSIVNDDLIGARYIFEKGIEIFPKDYDLLFNFAYLLTFELFDYKNAADIYQKLLKFKKAPKFIKSLLAKVIYKESDSLEKTLPIIKQLYLDEEDDIFKDKLKKDLYSISAEIDLKCLNSLNENLKCNRVDIDGQKYLKKGARYIAPQKYNQFKLHQKN